MHKAFAVIAVAAGLAACGMISTLVDGVKIASAVESDLELATGLKPQVSFNWSNGRLVTVTVTFPQLYESQTVARTRRDRTRCRRKRVQAKA